MADNSALAGLLERASQLLDLVVELASGIRENEFSPGDENRRRIASAWFALLPRVVEIGQSLPTEPNPVADWIREVGRVAQWFDDATQERGFSDVLFLSNCDGFIRVAEEGRALIQELSAKQHDPFAFVNDVPAETESVELHCPETPALQVAFLESLRDELHYTAEAKRHQFERGYSNETLASMVSGIRWAEAGQRISLLSELSGDTVEQVARVLRRELTVGTVEQIDELLGPAVRSVRDAWENHNLPPQAASGGVAVGVRTVRSRSVH